jgi:DNA polymerase zeta
MPSLSYQAISRAMFYHSPTVMTPDLSLRVQINQIDYTLAQPGPFDNSTLPKVPIIRVYGPTSLGKKACVHIHQVYPYFFVEYVEKMDPESG